MTPGPLPLVRTGSDGKLGGAWERGYTYDYKMEIIHQISHLSTKVFITTVFKVNIVSLYVFFVRFLYSCNRHATVSIV